MRRQVLCLCVLIMGVFIVSPVSAHISGNHEMGVVDGLVHLFTDPAHALLLLPALIVLYFARKITKGMRSNSR